MNTTLLHRLAWKELRSLRALWLSLLAMAFVMELGLAWLADRPLVRSEWVFTVALFLPVVYSLASAAMSFAGECEEGTDQFLSRLAAPPLPLLGVKLAMILLSTAALLAILYPLAWMLAPWQESSARDSLASRRMLALAWGVSLFSWGLFFSLLFRRVLACLVAATVAATLTPLVVFALLDLLPFRQARFETLDWTLRLAFIPGLLLMASALLVQTWDENRWSRIVELLLDGWWRLTAMRERPAGAARSMEKRSGDWRVLVRPFGLCLPDEWLPAWRREARRLLWLEWRQARRVMLFVIVVFGLYFTAQVTVVSGQSMFRDEVPCLLFLMAFVFGVWSFHDQQREQQFRDFTRHGASPTSMWLTKQAVWWLAMFTVAVTIMAATAWLQRNRQSSGDELQFAWLWKDESANQQRQWNEPDGWWRAFVQIAGRLSLGLRTINSFKDAHWGDALLRTFMPTRGEYFAMAALALTLSFAVGQFVSLLISRAVTATTVGFLLACMAFGWQQLMVELRVPAWLALLPLVAALLLASYLRMSDWLEERNTLRSWLKVGAGWLVVSLVTFIGVPWYRVAEVPRVSRDDQQLLDLAVVAKPTPAAKETAQRWLRAAESLEEEPIFRFPKMAERDEKTGGEAKIEFFRESPLSHFNTLEWADWNTLVNRDWVARHAELLAELERISREPACAFDELFSYDTDGARAGFVFGRFQRLAALLKMAAQVAISEGRLDEAASHALTLLRFGRHQQERQPVRGLYHGIEIEAYAFELLLNWARHPGHTSESLHAALGRSPAGAKNPIAALYVPSPYPRRPLTDALFQDYLVARNASDSFWQELPAPLSWAGWERIRQQRVLDFSVAQSQRQLQNLYDENEFVVGRRIHGQHSLSASGQVELLRRTSRMTRFEVADNLWMIDQVANSLADVEMRRRALLLTLAVRAFAVDHGRLPSRWDDLIGEYLDALPVDPWSGQPFEYRPEGYPFAVNRGIETFPEHTPLFMSGGRRHRRLARVTVQEWEQGKLTSRVGWTWTTDGTGSGSFIRSEPWPGKNRGRGDEFLCYPLTATEP